MRTKNYYGQSRGGSPPPPYTFHLQPLTILLPGHLDENDRFSTMQILRCLELQRSAIASSDIRLEVQLSEACSLLVEIDIRSTMRDLKLAIEEQGLGLNTFPCTLCDAGRDDMRDPEKIKLGFPINRSNELMHSAGHMARVNPLNLNKEELGARLKGSKGVPLTLGDKPIVRNSFESLHFKLSLGRWVKKILAHLNAGIYVWSIDKNLKASFQPHEQQLNSDLCKVLGIQKRLNLQGNEADKILNPRNIPDVLSLLTKSDHLADLTFLMTEVSFLNMVIQSLKPKECYSIVEFDQRAKRLQLFLLERLPWVAWPTYLHVGLAHTREILTASDSIALYSAQSKEVSVTLSLGKASEKKYGIIWEFFPT